MIDLNPNKYNDLFSAGLSAALGFIIVGFLAFTPSVTHAAFDFSGVGTDTLVADTFGGSQEIIAYDADGGILSQTDGYIEFPVATWEGVINDSSFRLLNPVPTGSCDSLNYDDCLIAGETNVVGDEVGYGIYEGLWQVYTEPVPSASTTIQVLVSTDLTFLWFSLGYLIWAGTFLLVFFLARLFLTR